MWLLIIDKPAGSAFRIKSGHVALIGVRQLSAAVRITTIDLIVACFIGHWVVDACAVVANGIPSHFSVEVQIIVFRLNGNFHSDHVSTAAFVILFDRIAE